MNICVYSTLKNYDKADKIFTKIHQASSSPLKNHRVCKNAGIGTHFYDSQKIERPYNKKITYFYEYENGNKLSLCCGTATIPEEIGVPDTFIQITDDEVLIDEDKINQWKIHQ